MSSPTIDPASYAPFASPEDYIVGWTDLIWDDFGLGRLGEHYAEDMVAHTAYGPIRGMETVLKHSLVKKATYPNRVGTAEDVICESRGDGSFISHHRVFHSGKQEGVSSYGLASTRESESRNLAICLVRDGLVVEEWVVRDEFRVVATLGLDPETVARDLAYTSEPGGLFDKPAPADPLTVGESGPRPGAHGAEAQLVKDFIEQVWHGRHLERVDEFLHPHVFCETTRGRIVTRHKGYQVDLVQMLSAFPDAKIEVRDIAVASGSDRGTRASVLWRLSGTYDGAPVYGPVTGSPIEIMGASQFLLREGRIVHEWRVFDEIAVLTQVIRARGEA